MTQEEVVLLCQYVAAACPSQQFGEYTADVWSDIIPTDFSLAECRQAVIAIKQRQTWVDVSDIITEVRRCRRATAERHSIRTLLDPVRYRAQIAAADDLVLRKIQKRAGRRLELKSVPPADYSPDGTGTRRAIKGGQP